MYTATQNQKAVSAYFTSKQILPFAFAEQYNGLNVLPAAFSAIIMRTSDCCDGVCGWKILRMILLSRYGD